MIGIVSGLGVAAAVTHLLTAMLYEMSPSDPLVYVLVTRLLAVTAIAVTVVPARRAVAVDPLIALREE